MAKDIIGREIQVDDFVVFYSNIYQVKSVGKDSAKIKIWNGGQTSRPVAKYGREMAILDKNDVLIWMLKTGS